MSNANEFGQPVGPAVPEWTGAARPPFLAMEGRLCRLEPLDAAVHLDDLYEAYAQDVDGKLWTYMFVGPFPAKAEFKEWLNSVTDSEDPFFMVIIERAVDMAESQSRDRAVGLASYMRIKPELGAIEVGNITYSPRLQRTALATEAMFLMMARVFDQLGYRRYEWKCDALNAPSRRAADRLGFSFDGIFEQALVYKGRNRDTAWYSILDRDWPMLKQAYLEWLAPENFDPEGRQKSSLRDLTDRARTSGS